MIVKNEAPTIARCLASVLPIIDSWIVVDTGSTDGTQEIVRDALRDLPGELHERPWVDFAHNRSEALTLARPRGDYSFIIDADDVLELPPGFAMPRLDAESYTIEIRHQEFRYRRAQLVRNTLPWRYEGVLHEFLSCRVEKSEKRVFSEDKIQKPLPGVAIRMSEGGARRRQAKSERYARDAAILETALARETDPFLVSRYTFYLAQSLKDAGDKRQAIQYYGKRATFGFWDQEVFVSLYESANLKGDLGFDDEDVIATYLAAHAIRGNRAEALHGAARFCRSKDRFQQGYDFAKRALTIRLPADVLFLQPWVYDYGVLDEFAVNAYWIGRYADCLDACERMLREGKIPQDMRGRVEKNAWFAREKLSARPSEKAESAEAMPVAEAQAATAPAPRVLLAILAKQKEKVLPFYLLCIEALDYPKKSIVLHVRTNNNTDRTASLLRDWVARVGDRYAGVEFDDSDVPEPVEQFDVHEWNTTRFQVLARLRQDSLQRALRTDCAYYFVADVDNFIRPHTLKELIYTRLPIVGPLLRHGDEKHPYSNFHEKINERGYRLDNEEYYWLLNQRVKGLCKVPVVHCTYLVRADAIPALSYQDDSGRHEYVVFAESARKADVAQYLDTREVYGYLTLEEDPDRAMKLIGSQIGAKILTDQKSDKPRLFACFGLHSSGSTWMFNLVRDICRAKDLDFVSLHRDSEANLPWDQLGSRLIVVRSHNPFDNFQAFIANTGEPAVLTVRDPRDAVVSFMQRFPTTQASSFEEALKAIVFSARTLVAVSRQRELPVFRYEDGFVGSGETFDRIAGMLRMRFSDDRRQEILVALSPDAVKRTISGLEAAGSIRGEAVWDRETHWHANHVGDGRIGKFKTLLSPAQQRAIIDQTRDYCDCFGYDTTVADDP